MEKWVDGGLENKFRQKKSRKIRDKNKKGRERKRLRMKSRINKVWKIEKGGKKESQKKGIYIRSK